MTTTHQHPAIQRVKEGLSAMTLRTTEFRGQTTLIANKSDVHELLRFLRDDPECDFDLLSGARINNMKIAEVPVNYRERTEGETKMTNTIFNGIRMFIICFYSLLKIRFN